MSNTLREQITAARANSMTVKAIAELAGISIYRVSTLVKEWNIPWTPITSKPQFDGVGISKDPKSKPGRKMTAESLRHLHIDGDTMTCDCGGTTLLRTGGVDHYTDHERQSDVDRFKAAHIACGRCR